ncbi:MAG: O-methyltransferase, partial [Dehalococcoidia bacterium]
MINIVSEEIEAYAFKHTTALPPLLEEVRQETYRTMEFPGMLSDQLVGTLLQTLIYASGAKKVLEIGMFTGFSALMMAHALPDGGKLITCDVNPKVEEKARSFFDKTPHGKKIEIRMGPALDTLKTLSGPFDLVFIDADKREYIDYYERCLELLSPGGL